MLEWIPLLVVTVAYIGILAYSFTSAELHQIRTHWNERRCEPLVMAMAHLIPTDPNVDRSEFSTENFKFCMNSFIDSSLALFFKPFLAIFGSQMDSANVISKVTSSLRTAAASLMKPFSGIFTQLFQKMKLILFRFNQIFVSIRFLLKRIEGIFVAKVFAGMSLMRAILNTINFVIRVIIIILAILIILMIFLWYYMFPYIPTILAVIAVIATTAAGASASGMSSAFCVAPGTEVAMEDGSWRAVETLRPGDRLASMGGPNIVEGVLEAKGGPDASCVRVKGVSLSADHIVFDWSTQQWTYASRLTEATPLTPDENPAVLYCLNTTTHNWTVRGEGGSLLLRDWEELPLTQDIDDEWERMIYEMLNREALAFPTASSGRGLFGPETRVEVRDKGVVPIHTVKLGDWVRDKGGEWTEVLATYVDNATDTPLKGPNEAVWMWYDGKRVWRHPWFSVENKKGMDGFHLITTSGTFLIENEFLVRDMTEIGIQRLAETYPFTLTSLNSQT